MLQSLDENNSLTGSLVNKSLPASRPITNQARTLNLKSNGGATVKLNKILLHHVQNPNINKIESSKLPKFDSDNSSQSFNTTKSGRTPTQRPSVLEFSAHSVNYSSHIQKLTNSMSVRGTKKPNARSLSNGHLRPIQKAPTENETTFMKPVRTPQLFRIEKGSSSIQTKFSMLGDQNNSLSPDGKSERIRKKTPENTSRITKKHIRQRSLLELQSEAKKINNSIIKTEKKVTQSYKMDYSEQNFIPPLKANENIKYRNLVFNPNASDITVNRHIKSVIEGLDYALNHLKPPSLAYVESRQVLLEKKNKKFSKTLVLDLDETLMTSCSIEEKPDLILTPNEDMKLMMKVRPFAQQFLNAMKDHFEIVVFTASSELYAKTVVSALDPKMECVSYIFHRGFCFETSKGLRIKDLRIFKNRDLKDIIMVDNFVPAFSFQIENGVPILEWKGDRQDKELMYIMDYLIKAKDYNDIREYNREKLNLIKLAKESLVEEWAP